MRLYNIETYDDDARELLRDLFKAQVCFHGEAKASENDAVYFLRTMENFDIHNITLNDDGSYTFVYPLHIQKLLGDGMETGSFDFKNLYIVYHVDNGYPCSLPIHDGNGKNDNKRADREANIKQIKEKFDDVYPLVNNVNLFIKDKSLGWANIKQMILSNSSRNCNLI